MDQERIKALIELLAESDLIELSLTEGDSTVRLFKDATGSLAQAGLTKKLVSQPAAKGSQATAEHEGPTLSSKPLASEVKASLYGVLHLTPSAGEAPFVRVGDSVEAGQTLAVLEAMKMFHPLKAPFSGIVEAILASAGSEVESGQPLFRLVDPDTLLSS